MKAQISRISHQPDKQYSGVFQQQGRMITDADWNELMAVIKSRQEQASKLTIESGVPRENGFLSISEDRTTVGDIQVTVNLNWGALVVDGILAEVLPDESADSDFAYNKQRFFPSAPPIPGESNITLYADVWERLVISLEDEKLRDPALHGADTCVRTQFMAQIKYVDTDKASHIEDRELNPPHGTAIFNLNRVDDHTAVDPCLTQTSIAKELGNYLFRLEVHEVEGDADTPNQIILKWSSENGAEAHKVEDTPTEFRQGNWIYEFFNDTTEKHLGVHLGAKPETLPYLETSSSYPDPIPVDETTELEYPCVRRWDGYCTIQQASDHWTLLEGKHQGQDITKDINTKMTPEGDLTIRLNDLELTVNCEGKAFVTGDYWFALLRQTNDNGGTPERVSKEPVGIVHHYLKLVDIKYDNTINTDNLTPDDVRMFSFPSLTNITADRVGYDPLIKQERWKDIKEIDLDGSLGSPPKPATVQDAIDDMLDNLESSDVSYRLPSCQEDQTNFKKLLSATLGDEWDYDGDSRITLRDIIDNLMCYLDSATLPYSTNDIRTIKNVLDALRTDVDNKVNRPGDTMTGDLAVMAKVGIGVDRDSSAVPGGKLHIDGGSTSKTFPNVSAAIEVDHSGDNTAVFQANGPTSSYRIALQDGHGRVSHTWNAYDTGSVHQYDSSEEGAVWCRFHSGDFSIRTAQPGDANAEITWQLGFYQDQKGHVGIGKDSPNSELDVDGTVEMKGFKLTEGDQVEGYVLTLNSLGVGEWKVSSPEGWRVDVVNKYVYAKIADSQDVKVGIGTDNPSGRLTVSDSRLNVSGIEFIGDGVNSHIPWIDGEIYLTGDMRPGRDPQYKGTGDFNYRTYHGGDKYIQHFRIKGDSGRVGIGEIDPSSNLHIKGANATLRIQADSVGSTGTDGPKIRLTEGSNNQGAYLYYDSTGDRFSIGVHHTNDKDLANDKSAISISRGTANVTISNELAANGGIVGNLTGTANRANQANNSDLLGGRPPSDFDNDAHDHERYLKSDFENFPSWYNTILPKETIEIETISGDVNAVYVISYQFLNSDDSKDSRTYFCGGPYYGYIDFWYDNDDEKWYLRNSHTSVKLWITISKFSRVHL